jgi:predicted nucleic acid-binding protein
LGPRLHGDARAAARRMALAGPLAAARLIALDTSAFIYLIEKHPTFFSAVEPIFQAVDAGTVQAATSVLTLLEVLVKPLEANAIALADDFRVAVSASANLRVIEVDRSVADLAASIRATYGYRTPDAIHLATAQLSGADLFVTNDDKLRGFSGVTVVSLRTLLVP